MLSARENQPLISVVSPVYRGERIIGDLVRQIKAALERITDRFEIVLVEDHSPDLSWQQIEAACASDSRVKGIKLSRNFGQHKAIAAGLRYSTGDWVVVMDCDLQDVPAEIPRLYAKAKEGFHIVQAQRVDRQDSFIKRSFSRAFYKVLSYLTDTKLDPSIANYGIYSRKVIAQINDMSESFYFFPLLVRWIGFSSVALPIAHSRRLEGTSSYQFGRLLRLGADVIIAFSDKPLRLVVKFGFLISFTSLIVGAWFFINALCGNYSALGWPSLIVSIWLLSGVVILIQGLVGLYVGKTFDESKKRKPFIAEQVVNVDIDPR